MHEQLEREPSTKVSYETLEPLIKEALLRQGKTLSDEEVKLLNQRLQNLQRFERLHRAHLDRPKLRESKEKASQLAGTFAASLGSSAAAGLAASLIAPAAPVLAITSAAIALIGGWLVGHKIAHEHEHEQEKEMQNK
jgi:uncharacterized protein YheU (UPF0270 family)